MPAVVRYHSTIGTVKYVHGVAPPVARVQLGAILETNTLDAFGNVIRKPGDALSLVKGVPGPELRHALPSGFSVITCLRLAEARRIASNTASRSFATSSARKRRTM